MSKAFLQGLLNELYAELKKDSQEFREDDEVSVHRFIVSRPKLEAEIYEELSSKGYIEDNLTVEDAAKLADVVTTEAARITDAIWNKFSEGGTLSRDSVIAPGSNRANFTVLTSIRKYGYIWDPRSKSGRMGIQTTVQVIKESYKSQYRTMKKNLNKVLSEIGAKQIPATTPFLNLGHRGGSAIVEQRIAGAKTRLLNEAVGRADSYDGYKITEKDLKDLGLNIRMSKKSTSARDVTEVSLEGDSLNKSRGAGKEAQAKRIYLNQIEKAIKKLDKSKKWATRPGSDSRVEIEKKKIVESFKKSLKTNTKVKKNFIDTKLDLSNSTVSKKVKKKAKAGTTNTVKLGGLGLSKAPKQRTSASSTITLAALINQKLPQTVAKNMKLPGLQYRTGRFAGSARVTDVTTTAQGYPSIGYTYQKNPYQTFEPGYRQGSVDRDPRKVIDRSIREIAATLLVGRFYTRRV